jgi:hypothetical protein
MLKNAPLIEMKLGKFYVYMPDAPGDKKNKTGRLPQMRDGARKLC